MTIFHRTEKENPKMSMGTNIISLFPTRKQWKQSRCSPLSRLMDKENIVHICNGIFLSYKKKVKFAGKQVYLEFTILSKVIQT